MAEYKETPISGTSYLRCSDFGITDPLGPGRFIRFTEEEVTVIDGNRRVRPLGQIIVSLKNGIMNESFQIRDLNTNDPIPGQTTTYRNLLRALKSAYWDIAARRDSGTLPVDE